MADFERALDHVLEWEGGFVDHPADPGGATNMGITQATLAHHRGEAVTADDVRALTREEAEEIYLVRYWDRMRCSEMGDGLDLLVFDSAVNHGVRNATVLLQRAVGARDDGILGPKTMRAVLRSDHSSLVVELAARRMVFYAEIHSFSTFGLGWSRRLMSTLAKAKAAE